ncbi:MAG: PTS glucose transporter subunit IIA [Lachnospiraceae bacterium]|nr:PTS glucose transporter subunit IIA [Lachnospiraceae bacterium]
MALDYRKCAEEIFSHLGGKENIVSAAHCATRLRLVIADNSKIDKAALEEVEGVKGMFESNGQLQLIIGTGTVNKVYDEFLAVTGLTAASKADVKAAAASRMPLWKKILKTPGDVFVPILPAIVASGLMMGLVEAIPKFAPAFGQSDWYSFLDLVANTAFALLPVLVAISAARVFGGNIFLGAVIGLMMVHPALINAWTVSSYAPGEIPTWHLFFFNVQQVGYQGHVIPVILAVLLMSTVEKWLHKKVPEMIDLFVTPLCTVLVTAFVTFTIIGPVFSVFENWVLTAARWLITVGHGIGAAIMGAIYPWTVVMGLHHMYNVIEAGMLSVEGGVNTWMPIASAANFAQFGACLAVALKVRNQKTKAVAFPSALSASLGITEPAIFGINFRFMKPFICGMVGGAAGALFASIIGFGATTYGVTGIPGIPAVNNVPMYLIELIIAAGVAFALTWVIWKEDAPAAASASGGSKAAAPAAPEVPTNAVISCEAGKILQPTKGKVIAQEDIPDETFAGGILGAGVGIEPTEGVVVAPYDGEISSVAESRHAIGITGAGDMELLIHVGVDTVAMNGDGFTPLVAEGDKVKAGQVILRFDRAKIKAAGHPDTVVVLLTNSDDYENVKLGADAN